MTRFSTLADQAYSRISQTPLLAPAPAAGEEQAPPRGNRLEWAGLLARVGAFAGAFIACFAAGHANRGVAFLGVIGGAAVGGLVGLMIDCRC
jgi:hypothetical protein